MNKFVITLVVAVLFSTGALGADQNGAFNTGKHMGIIQYAMDHCKDKYQFNDRYRSIPALYLNSKELLPFYVMGFMESTKDMFKTEKKHGNKKACFTVGFLYGPKGATIRGALLAK